jgi:hypothetical protein
VKKGLQQSQTAKLPLGAAATMDTEEGVEDEENPDF